jgi:hypothetical protein
MVEALKPLNKWQIKLGGEHHYSFATGTEALEYILKMLTGVRPPKRDHIRWELWHNGVEIWAEEWRDD